MLVYFRKGRKPTEGWVTGAFTALMDTIWTGQFNALDPEPFRVSDVWIKTASSV